MKFEHGVRITTTLEPDQVRDFAIDQFRRVGTVGELRGELIIRKIQATFGSIQRYDASRLEVRRVGGGVMVVVRTLYQPSIPFWIFVLLGMFGYVLPALIPVAIYLYHKGLVQNAVKDVLFRVESELRAPSPVSAADSDDRAQPFRHDGAQRSEMIAISSGYPVDMVWVSVSKVAVNR